MTTKNRFKSKYSFLFIALLASLLAFKGEKDFLHKRKFNISLDEVKDGVASKKTIPDEFWFKDGRLWSDFINKKFGYEWIRYRINKDSVFIDSTETEVRMLEVEGSITDETNQTVMINFVLQEWDIDGTVKITKNDKIKKYYDFVGREKGGKPKKQKAPKKHLIEIKKEEGSTLSETLTPPPPPPNK